MSAPYVCPLTAGGGFRVFRMKNGFIKGAVAGWLLAWLLATGCGLTYPVDPPGMLRVSVDADGLEADGHSYNPAVSSDGRYIAFQSYATNLSVDDADASFDVYLHDLQTATTTLVSVDSGGVKGNSTSTYPDISDDGRYVVFASKADNLVAADGNLTWDVFLHDTVTGDTTRVSEATDGTEGNGRSEFPAISADGKYVAFVSSATNLDQVTADTNGQPDIFLHEVATGITTRVSMATDGTTQADQACALPDISDDGHYVAFHSWATNLDQVVNDTNSVSDVFRHDTVTGETIRVSMHSDGTTQGDGDSKRPAISGDGVYVAFDSLAATLTGDGNGVADVFLHDTATGETVLVSVDSVGTEGDGDSINPVITDDGAYVAFQSLAANLVGGDANGVSDIFLHDVGSGETALVSSGLEGNPAAGLSEDVDINPDGSVLVFESAAPNLILNDTNLQSDIFIAPNPFNL